jgi:hypothetical protein
LPSTDYPERIERLMSAKDRFALVLARMELPAVLAGATDAYRGSWALRLISRTVPGSESLVFEARQALFEADGPFGLPEGFTGACVFRLAGPDAMRLSAAATAAGFAILPALPRPARVAVEVLIPPPFAAGADDALRNWLSGMGVEWIEERAGPGRVLIAAGRDAARRPVTRAEILRVDAGDYAGVDAPPGGESARYRLEIGPRARLSGWFDLLGARAGKAAKVRVLDFD